MKNDYKMMMDKLENFLINKWCFSIPRYQRKYIWSKENIKQLIEDINLYNCSLAEESLVEFDNK